MPSKIKTADLMGISFLIYSIYFGAGNLIFPIRVGYRVGDEIGIAMVGFILAAVVLPGIVLWACTKVGGGLDDMCKPLPKFLGLFIAISLYLIVGPFLGLPRFSGVAYQTIQPLTGVSSSMGQLIFSLLFFSVTLVFAIKPGRILAIVGKFMAPMLVLVLLLVAGGAVFAPQGPVATPDPLLSTRGATGFFVFGFEEGYQTLNAIGSLILGIVIMTSVRGLNLEESDVRHYTMKGMVFAGTGLAITFAALSYLGATSHSLVDIPTTEVTGAEISPPYAQALFGIWGAIALAIVVTLACLTTAIGLISACGQYFSKVFPVFDYKKWTIMFSILSVVVANMGLGPLLATMRPVLLGVYPIAMCIALLSLVKDKMPDERFVFMFTLIPVIPLGIVEGIKATGSQAFQGLYDALSWLPLFWEGFGWVLPGLLFFAIAMVITRGRSKDAPAA